MTKETKNSKSWLKGVLASRNQFDETGSEELSSIEQVEDGIHGEHDSSDQIGHNQILSKENQDKISLDMIVSLENLLHDRQLMLYKNKGLEGQLDSAGEMIDRLKLDIAKKDQLLIEKNEEISAIENNLTTKQMNYDQLLEDFKDHQNHAKNDFEKVTTKLEIEISKYTKLNEDFTNTQYRDMVKIKELEERIRDLEVENQKYLEQYQAALDEKNELMKTINDFTERMSFSFSPKSSSSQSE